MALELNRQTIEKIQINVHKTEKYWVHTNQGKLLDLLMGNTAYIFGYDNQHIKNKMLEVGGKVAFLNWRANETCSDNSELVDKICSIGGYSSLAWAVSGSDGVECAVSMNDTYWQGIDPLRTQIISFAPGYHGATYLERLFRREQSVDTNNKVIVLDAPTWTDINDRPIQEQQLLESVEKTLQENFKVGAVIFESFPWYDGIRPWSNIFWKTLRDLCTRYDVNLILDDVLGGVGKLGHFFSQDRHNIKADITVLGKALTGGYSPLSCACTNKKIHAVIKDNFYYGHTWQPNMFGVGAALGVIELFDSTQIKLIEDRLTTLGTQLVSDKLIKRFDAQGLMINMDLQKTFSPDHFTTNGIILNSGWITAPVIADDEYFEELEKRLINSLK
jgi:adenosylmethionine-8-amino-7-oxononanoate aminotransferase